MRGKIGFFILLYFWGLGFCQANLPCIVRVLSVAGSVAVAVGVCIGDAWHFTCDTIHLFFLIYILGLFLYQCYSPKTLRDCSLPCMRQLQKKKKIKLFFKKFKQSEKCFFFKCKKDGVATKKLLIWLFMNIFFDN